MLSTFSCDYRPSVYLLWRNSYSKPFAVVQLLSHVWLFAIPWTAAPQAFLSFTISRSLLKLMSIESVMLSNRLALHCLLLLSSVFPSIRVFYSESALCIRWPKHWSFSFSISPFNEYSESISFKIDWFDLPASRESQESSPAPQFKNISSLTLSLLCGPHTHPYMMTRKTIPFLIQTLVAKWCLCSLVYCLGISWASLVAQTVKHLLAMQETWVWSLGRKDPLEKEMATHSSVFA